MKKEEFLNVLESLLTDITPEEREEALQYYSDYISDAGSQNEEEVIKALGAPSELAKEINYGIGEGESSGEFTEQGYKARKTRKNGDLVIHEAGMENDSKGQPEPNEKQETKPKSTGWLILVVILGIFAAPFLIIFVATLAILLFSLIVTALALAFSVFILVAAIIFSLIVCAIAFIPVGIVKMFTAPFGGLVLLGCGLICGGLSLVFIQLMLILMKSLLPSVCRFVVSCIKKIMSWCTGLFQKGGIK